MLFALATLASPNGLGITPPMGWNPYNHMKSTGFKWKVTEQTLYDTAAALKSSGLQALGYTYVNLDAGWSLKDRDNATGRPQPDPALFPNIANGGVAKHLHGMGFHFGIYSDSGTLHCGGGGPGGLGHETVDAQAYAAWGVDFLKYDNCFVPPEIQGKPIPRYTAMSEALNATGRPIFFAMCEWGVADPATWGASISNSWRTTADMSDLWWAMCELADLTAEWFEYAGPGHWNDPDLLEVGNGGMTEGEYRSQMSIWCLIKAPLLISTDVTAMSEATLGLLSNDELIAINQDRLGVAGRLVEERPPDPVHLQVWAGPLSGGRVAVVLWNRGNGTQEILGRFVDMQLDGSAKVRDCIAHADLGVATGQVNLNVSAHDVRVLVLTPTPKVGEEETTRRAWTAADDAAWAARWKGHGIRRPQSRLAWEAAKAQRAAVVVES
tara:strand:- start:1996 stop:3309 length:1314 start_codon:yes stop_codon:yes gene_type:complete